MVVSDLGPPEEGVRHTQPAVATFVNRFQNSRKSSKVLWAALVDIKSDQEVNGDGDALHL